MKIFNALNKGKRLLLNAGIDQPLRESKLIICHALNINTKNCILDLEKIITDVQLKNIYSLLNRRAKGEPFAYLTKSINFLNNNFYINKNVLIPRPETEELVEYILIKILDKNKKFYVLDIGTGSGVILASLLKHLPKSYGIGTDISINALNIARKNLNNLNLNNRTNLINANWAESLKNNIFDIIICNPPYISDNHIKNLHKEVKNYEPLTALKGGKDGLNSLRSLLPSARKVIKNNGLAVFEIGFDQSSKVEKIFNDNNFLIKRIDKDLSGIERIIIAKPN